MADEPAAFDLETVAEANNYAEWIYAGMRPWLGRHVLELGCGIGTLTPLFLREGRVVMAIDVDERMVQAHERRLGSPPGLSVRHTTIQTLLPELAGSFDSIVSANVLEHIPDGEEDEVIRATYALLKPGGASVHWVPACPSVYGSLDRAFGHRRRYHKAQLTAAFARAGFQVRECRYVNSLGLFGWWWHGRVLKRTRICPKSAVAFDRCVVPVLRRVEALLWLPAGQSLLIVAQKP
jgi:2-polyprenyl-3-methyl-5-hydroxy-6-metoxy-1,4-benzoquinol methylase